MLAMEGSCMFLRVINDVLCLNVKMLCIEC